MSFKRRITKIDFFYFDIATTNEKKKKIMAVEETFSDKSW